MDPASVPVFISSFAYNFVRKKARITIFSMRFTSRWIMDRFNVQGRKVAVREHFVSGEYLRMYLSDCLQNSHTTPLVGLVVPFGVYEL